MVSHFLITHPNLISLRVLCVSVVKSPSVTFSPSSELSYRGRMERRHPILPSFQPSILPPLPRSLSRHLYSWRLKPMVARGGKVKTRECERPCHAIGSA